MPQNPPVDNPRPTTGRRRWLWIGAAVVTTLALILALLPEVVRRVAIMQIRNATGREVAIDDVDLNLFTGALVVKSLRLLERGRAQPFVEFERLAARLRLLPLVTGRVRIAEIHLQGPTVRIVRAASGVFNFSDLLAPASAGKTERRGLYVALDRLTLERGVLLVRDETLTPPRTQQVDNLVLDVRDISFWAPEPERARSPVHLRAGLAGGGRLEARGSVGLAPLAAELRLTLTDVDLASFQSYLPVSGEITGKADTDVMVTVATGERLTARVTGTAGVSRLAVSDGKTPALEVERMETTGIDVNWPSRVAIAKVSIQKAAATIERNARGELPLRALLARRPTTGQPEPQPAASPPEPRAPATRIAIDVNEIVLTDGYARFVDRMNRPPYSEELSRLVVSIKGLSNAPGKRARIEAQGILGGGAALTISGDIAPLADTLFIDLDGELRNFVIPRINSILDRILAWIAREGRVTTKVRYRIEGDRLVASSELVIGRLQVAPSGERDEVKRRLGLPLGLIVALMKDAKGEIRVSVPVSGRLGSPEFNFREAIWAAVRNVVISILATPFRLVGGVFTRGDTIEALKVDPVRFGPGSAALSSEMARHLERVADLLKSSPYIRLSLTPVVTRDDVTTLALLRERAPEPETDKREIAERRVQTVREALDALAIPADRLSSVPAGPVQADPAGGRIEFSITE